MQIKVKFYKKSKSTFGKLIVRQQRVFGIPERYARYSHVEIWLGNKLYKIDDVVDPQLIDQNGLAFSSSEEDSGCRFKCITWNPEHWDSCTIDVSTEQFKKIIKFCRTQNGNRYGTFAIFMAQIFNFNWKTKGTWFCSEIVTHALQQAGMLCTMNSLFTKPGELALELESEGYIIE